mgnify:FL=1
MNTAIQRLNEKICEEYTVEIACDQSHIIDRYEEGELEEVSFVKDFYNSKRESTVENIGSNVKEVVEYVLKSYTQFNTFEEYFNDNFNYSDDFFIVHRQVNSNHNEPTANEVEMWKIGEEDLYAQYTHIKLYVNSTLLDVDMIRSLIEGSK